MTKKSTSKTGALTAVNAATASVATVATEVLPQIVSSGLSVTATGYIAAAISSATKRIYATDTKHFAASGITVPATPAQVLEYLAQFAGQLAIATLERRLNFLHKAHVEKMLPSPTTDLMVRQAMRGIRRTFGTRQRQVKPMVRDDVLEALVMIDRQRPVKAARDRALMLIGFAGAFRRSELVAIRVEHLTPVNLGIEVFLPHSKTDQERQGRTVFIPYANDESRCPVIALARWLTIAEIKEGFVFRAVTRHDRVARSGLSAQSVALVVKSSVARVGGDATKVSGHSLRAGFCTQAAMSGLQAYQIKETTGHKSDAMLSVYIRPVNRRKSPSLL
ncbi:site-specific integrase [Rhodoferax sp.]|uniref:site-specific integrase n=1 Tax=Rhodoferax sp. TaxID=50421 RepID=UPI00374CB5BD